MDSKTDPWNYDLWYSLAGKYLRNQHRPIQAAHQRAYDELLARERNDRATADWVRLHVLPLGNTEENRNEK